MLDNITLLFSIFIGCILGSIYGFSLIFQKEKIHPSYFCILTIVRLILFAGILFYLLHYKLIQIILFICSFIISYWTVIVKYNPEN